MPLVLLLAQAPPQGRADTGAVFVWIAALIGIVLVGGIVMVVLRRRMFAADSTSEATGGLMESLRRLKDSGQMSQEEYDAARKAMATRVMQAQGPVAAPPQ